MSAAVAASRAEPGILLRADRDGVATLTLNRAGARNALSQAMLAALQVELDAIAADRTVGAVVLAGNGPAFCAGHDLKEIRANRSREIYESLLAQCARVMITITRLPKPVIARVHGLATAAGCQLVATCDLAVASTEASFATPGVHIGLFCSTPMVALSRAVGRKAAMEMLLTGDAISAECAREIGLINRVVAPESLDDEVGRLAGHIAGKSPLAIAIGKDAFYRQIELDLEEAYVYASRVMTENLMARDAEEGITAFIDKRPPVWRGE
ncbi:MAG: enoyl-CoA hydratase [Alphaproteobacteria bacterium]|jgi:enoyl-CoA hydratase/carnithine racemase|nr:enoyl-CoA hydratase [Alphaproteobacteria bacterium]MDP6515974.1 enoyl-CoA hydratase [Alphaproteobacteria bacterium]